MDIVLPAVVAAPPGGGAPAAPGATELATDAAFAALLATLVAAQAPPPPAPVVVAMAAPAGVDAAPTPAAVDLPVVAAAPASIPVPAAAPDPAPAPPADEAAEAVLGAVERHPWRPTAPSSPEWAADATAPLADPPAPVEGEAAEGAPTPAAPKGAERVVPQPVAPPDSEILLARALTATATTVAAAPVVLPTTATEPEPSPTALAGIVPVEVTATGGAAPAEVAKPVAPAVAPRAAEQVVRVIAPLRAAADGTYELGLELRPEGLGRVQLDVTVERGVVHVAIRTETAVAGDLLHRSLPDVRAGLADAGLTAGRLGVQADASGDGRHAMPGHPNGDGDTRRGSRPTPDQPLHDDRPPVAPAYADSRLGGVDVFL